MLGTLNGALEVRHVSLPADAISAAVEADNHVIDKIPTLTRLHVKYRLRIPPDSGAVVDRALASHQSKCPSAQSLKGSVEISWSAHIEDAS